MKSSPEQADLRVRRTHKLLWEALMAEMSERPFEEISVTDICERAMVHRTTFYKHYEDKYALLEQGMRQMYDALLSVRQHLPPSAYSIEQPPPYFVGSLSMWRSMSVSIAWRSVVTALAASSGCSGTTSSIWRQPGCVRNTSLVINRYPSKSMPAIWRAESLACWPGG